MKISDIILKLQSMQNKHGDLKLEHTWFCNECEDDHDGSLYEIEKTIRNTVVIRGVSEY